MVSVARYIFILLNFVHIIIGVFLVSFGAWLRYASPIKEVLNYYTASFVVINIAMAFGVIFILFGIFGSVIDVAHNQRILTAFLMLNVIVLILEITALAYGYTQRDSLANELQTVWNSQPVVNKYIIQERFNCCGYAGPSEYNGIYDTSCLSNVTAVIPWTVGCSSSITSWLNDNVVALAVMVGLLLVVSAGQVIMSSKLLYDKVKSDNTVQDEGDLIIKNETDEVNVATSKTNLNKEM